MDFVDCKRYIIQVLTDAIKDHNYIEYDFNIIHSLPFEVREEYAIYVSSQYIFVPSKWQLSSEEVVKNQIELFLDWIQRDFIWWISNPTNAKDSYIFNFCYMGDKDLNQIIQTAEKIKKLHAFV